MINLFLIALTGIKHLGQGICLWNSSFTWYLTPSQDLSYLVLLVAFRLEQCQERNYRRNMTATTLAPLILRNLISLVFSPFFQLSALLRFRKCSNIEVSASNFLIYFAPFFESPLVLHKQLQKHSQSRKSLPSNVILRPFKIRTPTMARLHRHATLPRPLHQLRRTHHKLLSSLQRQLQYLPTAHIPTHQPQPGHLRDLGLDARAIHV